MRCAQPLPERFTGGAEGSELIAIFTVVGCGLLSGGLYAIYSGWPYLVLERGFTQVIVGSVAATAGLLMLSLAWVLRELKAMRRDFAEAAAPAYGYAEDPVPAAMPAPVLPPSEPPRASLGPVPDTGAAAVAGAAVAAAWPRAEVSEEDKAPAQTADRDLFGALVAERLAEEPIAAPHAAELETEASPTVPDLFAPPLDNEAESRPAILPEESDEPAEVVAAKVQPLSQDEALAKSDSAEAEPVETGFVADSGLGPEAETAHASGDPVAVAPPEAGRDRRPADEAGTATLEQVQPQPLQAEPEPEIDEFRALRESLTSELNGPAYAPRRIEPALGIERPVFGGGEEFFQGSPRREPSFAPVEAEAEPVPTAEQPLPPAWPPRTGTASFDEPLDGPTGEIDVPPQPASDVKAEPERPSEPDAPAPEERASSEEGIVGAYQVGDAHFTIFADGSIRARTPDGEYSFASMDELKVYLASEKSRLGV
ncbi:hypothetical protein SAMN05880592_101722 [Bosea sp. TND4EK4]|nr:hypothetical protein SAMN05880592_101722 [Bosea sp. TND4EK4]